MLWSTQPFQVLQAVATKEFCNTPSKVDNLNASCRDWQKLRASLMLPSKTLQYGWFSGISFSYSIHSPRPEPTDSGPGIIYNRDHSPVVFQAKPSVPGGQRTAFKRCSWDQAVRMRCIHCICSAWCPLSYGKKRSVNHLCVTGPCPE